MMLPAQPPAAAAPQPSRNRRWGGSVCPRPPPCCCGGASGISSHNRGPGPTAPWPWLPSCRRAAACQVAACCRGKGDLFLNSWLKSCLHLQQKGEAAVLRGCGQRSGRAASGAALCRQRCPAWKGPSGSLAPRESCRGKQLTPGLGPSPISLPSPFQLPVLPQQDAATRLHKLPPSWVGTVPQPVKPAPKPRGPFGSVSAFLPRQKAALSPNRRAEETKNAQLLVFSCL